MPRPPPVEESLEEFPHPWWILHVDGAVNNEGTGACIVLVSPEGHHLMSAIHFKFYATNNDAEYEALINGLKVALEMEVRNLIVRSDSELVVNQNSNADALAKMRLQQEVVLLGSIHLEIQENPSIPEIEIMQVDEAPKETWITPILSYIHKGTLPEDKFKARRLRYQAARYVVYDEVLYKRGFNQPMLRCVDEEEGNYILREGMRSLPALCELLIYASNALDIYDEPVAIFMWGIDLIGQLPKAKGDVKYAVVAVDYFTKWAEVMPLATITAKKIKDFVFNSIVCRFRIPYKLVSDNKKQFDSKELQPSKLEERKGNWPEELPKVMWSYNTTLRSTTGKTPFMLTYDYEAMVPVEVGLGSLCRDRYKEEDAEVNQRLHLDLLEETRENSQLRLAAYQQRVTRYYNKKVNGQLLRVGDLVLRKVMSNTKDPQHIVFGAN
ncbi:uncharacterized protein LOC141696508 [Apium graveolens]|uniref:uncharacterized protein LOC141696508 n=1 Tax=Apium graveolens TaxID=4045 RepID=UPI003D7B55A1